MGILVAMMAERRKRASLRRHVSLSQSYPRRHDLQMAMFICGGMGGNSQ